MFLLGSWLRGDGLLRRFRLLFDGWLRSSLFRSAPFFFCRELRRDHCGDGVNVHFVDLSGIAEILTDALKLYLGVEEPN